MSIPAGTKFIGIAADVDTYERKSAQANSPSNVYTIEEIVDGTVPDSRTITINGNTQDLTANRNYNVTDANLSTSDITTNDVSINKHGFVPKAPNDTTKFLRGDGTWASAGSSGVWGISNASGVYTYYATLTLAMAAASSGQTIEMFADVTETANVTIAMKSEVIINGNGHTYTYTNNSGVMFSFTSATSGNLAFYNINITRTNTASTGAAIFSFINNSVFINSRIDFSACVVRYTVTSGNSPIITADGIHRYTANNLICITNGGGTAVIGVSTADTINNCYIECNGTSSGFSSGTAKQSIIITQSGSGVSGSTATIYECVINCLTSGIGVLNVNGAYNCQVTTNTGACFDGQGIGSQTIYNCIARSVSGTCFYSTIAQNCQAYSTSGNAIALHFNYGDGRYKFYNCFLYSAGAIVSNAGRISLLNCTIVSGWNNAAGHAVRMDSASSLNEIANCVIDVANTSANCINATAATTVKYANTSFRTATTPVNANITQGITNSPDTKGNILL